MPAAPKDIEGQQQQQPPVTRRAVVCDGISILLYTLVFICMATGATAIAIEQAIASPWDALFTASATAIAYVVWVHSWTWWKTLRRTLTWTQWTIFVVCLFTTGGILVLGFMRLQEPAELRTERALWIMLGHEIALVAVFIWCMYCSIPVQVV